MRRRVRRVSHESRTSDGQLHVSREVRIKKGTIRGNKCVSGVVRGDECDSYPDQFNLPRFWQIYVSRIE